MPDTLRVALLGGGKMALQHAAAIRLCGNATLIAVVDPFIPAADLTARFGEHVVPYTDAREMLAAVRPDVVHIVTPPEAHASLALQCLEAGSNVYVEKPFALTSADAASVLALADRKGLRACAAHQVLFQEAARSYRQHLPMIGEIVHVESFFSFRPVRRRAGGGGLSTPVEQLIDILPHPVYLLLASLPTTEGTKAAITALDVSIEGEVRAVIRAGTALGCLVVSLRARPVESWLRVMGTNGMVEADFVLGNVIQHPGPGASAPAVVLKPFSRAWQMGWGSFKAVLRIAFGRQKSYPGLADLLRLFYASIRERAAAPITAQEIANTVRICEAIGTRLRADERKADEESAVRKQALEAALPPLNDRGIVLLTGGTGILGRPTAKALRSAGWRVRVPIRRQLSHSQQLPGIEYVSADLADSLPDTLMTGVETVVHLAAETAGTRSDHERNTILATRNLINSMVRSGTRRLINVSSVAVLKPSRRGRPLRENSPVDYDNLQRGPYVWAKAEAERIAMSAGQSDQLAVRTVRLGPLLDYESFAAPGRLGREVARLFVAMGRPSSPIPVCSIATASRVLSYMVGHFHSVAPLTNLLDVPTPTRGELTRRLSVVRPDLRSLWLPFWMLWLLNLAFRAAMKIRNPTAPTLDLYSAFKTESYDIDVAQELISKSSAEV